MRSTTMIRALAVTLALAGCGGGGGGDGGVTGGGTSTTTTSRACPAAAEKVAVLATARDWYLFDALLPPSVNLAEYATSSQLLDFLTAGARAQSLDRHWSFLTTRQSAQQFYDEGTTAGFGFGLLLRSQRLYVSQVLAGSPADAAGFARGDEILSIGQTAQTLVPVSSLVAQGALGASLGAAEPGVARAFDVQTAGGAAAVRVVTTAVHSIDPVPRWEIVPRPGLPPAGYVQLRTFVKPAEPPLRAAFAAFLAAGVTDVAIDLRYNGGGMVSTAELLANLLADGRDGEVMYRTKLNSLHGADETSTAFRLQPESLPAARIAFITTGASASASEMLPNVLAPYAQVAIVGAPTYGKPVGQFAFAFEDCDTLLYLVAFKHLNAQGGGDYFGGLPDASFPGRFCPAADDLSREPGSADELSTAAAAAFLATGQCPAPSAAAKPAPRSRDAAPVAASPTPARVEMPGVF